jgi:hypothetical protein
MAHLINRIFRHAYRPPISQGRVPEAAPKVEAVAVAADVAQDSAPKLTGSLKYRGGAVRSNGVHVGEREMTAHAWSNSGLSPEEWNKLSASERAKHFDAVLKAWQR